MNKIYLLKLDINNVVIDYDWNIGHVIICDGRRRAREIASNMAADEGKMIWYSSTKTILYTIGEPNIHHDKEQILLTDFNAG